MQFPEELQFILNARKPQRTTDTSLDGKTAIITGATSGVGYEAARALAAAGAELVIVVRNPEKAINTSQALQQEFGNAVHTVLADFSDLGQVRHAAEEVLSRFPNFQLLINNIGIHNTRRKLTPAGFEQVFVVNHLAPFLFTRLLLPRLVQNAPARVLQINSQGHRFGGLDLGDLNWEHRFYHGLRSYGAAKTAQLLTVWEMADRLAGRGVTINAMHPGAVRSNIGMNNGLLYRMYNRYFLRTFLKPAAVAGQAIHYLVAAPDMDTISGKYFNLTIEEKPAAHALNRELGQQVWQVSETLTGLNPWEKEAS